jgi:hypothetical protein
MLSKRFIKSFVVALLLCAFAAVLYHLSKPVAPITGDTIQRDREVTGEVDSTPTPHISAEKTDPILSQSAQPLDVASITTLPSAHETNNAPASAIPASVNSDPKNTANAAPDVISVPLHESPIAAMWLREDGVTADDIRQTVERLRRQGVPERVLNDPGMVRQYLPRRNVHAVHVGVLDIPERAPSGQAVPFSLSGALPDASYAFTHFDVVREDNRILIRPLGKTSGEAAPGVEIPVNLRGEIEPLPPGVYQIVYPGMPPDNLHLLTID